MDQTALDEMKYYIECETNSDQNQVFSQHKLGHDDQISIPILVLVDRSTTFRALYVICSVTLHLSHYKQTFRLS